MENLDLHSLYSVMLLFSCGLSIYSIFRNNSKDTQKDGVNEGTMQTDLAYIKDLLDKLDKTMSDLDAKMEAKYSAIEKEFRDLLIANAKLEENYKILHKRVDELFTTVTTNASKLEKLED